MAAVAAVEGLKVRFADTALEQQRLVADRRRRDEQGRDGTERGRWPAGSPLPTRVKHP